MIPKKYVKTVLPIYFLILLTVLVITITEAKAGGYPWKDHAKPYDFTFGNNFDTHQQTKLKANGDLDGFFYITFTGEEIGGIPVAEHCDGTTPAGACEVGWIIRGIFIGGAIAPTFVFHNGDHPIWLMGSRNDIPQPGTSNHFHWLGDPLGADGLVEGDRIDGYIFELQAVDEFYFRHSGGEILVMPGTDISSHVNIVGSFPGY